MTTTSARRGSLIPISVSGAPTQTTEREPRLLRSRHANDGGKHVEVSRFDAAKQVEYTARMISAATNRRASSFGSAATARAKIHSALVA
jgi:hypothetical protein